MMFAALAGNETRNGFSAFIMAVSTKPAHIPVTLMWARRVRARTLRPSRYEDTSALDAQCDAAPPLARSINMLAMTEHPGCRGEFVVVGQWRAGHVVDAAEALTAFSCPASPRPDSAPCGSLWRWASRFHRTNCPDGYGLCQRPPWAFSVSSAS